MDLSTLIFNFQARQKQCLCVFECRRPTESAWKAEQTASMTVSSYKLLFAVFIFIFSRYIKRALAPVWLLSQHLYCFFPLDIIHDLCHLSGRKIISEMDPGTKQLAKRSDHQNVVVGSKAGRISRSVSIFFQKAKNCSYSAFAEATVQFTLRIWSRIALSI